MPSNLLGPLITSKTRLKLLLRFFINQDVSGYLQGLSKELDENSNSVRVELNRLEEAGMLISELEGRKKLYRVNKSHPLTSDLTSMLRKVTGIDSLVERVVERIGEQLEQVWILGSLAQGLDSKTIEVLLIGKDLDSMYITNLIQKAEEHIGKAIKCTISAQYFPEQVEAGLLVWQKHVEK
jgi:DNA-binding transcriptional ArsR family regulator